MEPPTTDGHADTALSDPANAETAAAPAAVEMVVPRKRTVTLLAEGTVVDGDYRIVRLLGVGGMGVVYLARDLRLGREVALKIHNAVGRDAALRLAREAAAMARLTHPNVVAVHRVGEFDGEVFVAMEYVDGGTLRTWQAGDRSAAEIVASYAGAGDGLAAAHVAGLIHRDFKPENVLIGSDGRPRVADFGLAVSSTSAGDAEREHDLVTGSDGAGDLPRLTVTGDWAGTPGYMAPEQWTQGALDPRSDQFSFCVALWEALYGARPFAGHTQRELAASVIGGNLTEPVGARVPRHVDAALRRGLARSVESRFPSMNALVAALRDDPAARRRRIAAAALLLLLGTAAVIATVSANQRAATASPCAAIDDVASVWNPARRDHVAARFVALGVPWAARTSERTLLALDVRGAAWTKVAGRACRAARVSRSWTDEQYAVARHCLVRRLGEFGAVVDLLAGADEKLAQRATTLIDQLPAVESCADPVLLDLEVPPPNDPGLAAKVARLEARLDEVHGLQLAGRYDDAIAAADAMAADVAALGNAPLSASLAHRRAELAALRTDPDALARLTEAFFVARRAGRPVIAVQSALVLTTTSSRSGDHQAAELWWRVADADIIGLRLGVYYEAWIARVYSELLDSGGRLEEARIQAERALQLLGDQGLPDSHRDMRVVLDSLSSINQGLGRFDQSVEYARRVVAAIETSLGPVHPALTVALGNLGLSLASKGDNAGAEVAQLRALALARASFPANSPKVGFALHNLGSARIGSGRYPEAIESLREAVKVLTIALGPEHEDTAVAEGDLGLALMRNQEFDAAEAVLQTALVHARARRGPDHREVAVVLHNLGANALNAGHVARARDYLKQAVATYHRSNERLTSEASALADLAVVELELNNPKGAATAAAASIDRYRDSGIDPDVIARVEMLFAKGLWGIGDRDKARAAIAAAANHVVDDEELRAKIAAWQHAHP